MNFFSIGCLTQYRLLRAIFCFTLLAATAVAQDASKPQSSSNHGRAEQVLASMPKFARVEQVVISPDGSTIAWTDKQDVHIQSINGSALEQKITHPDHLSLRNPAWSNDGKHLAYIADAEGSAPSAQLWIADMPSGTPRKLADLKGYVSVPHFSPDGRSLAFLFIAGMPRIAGPLQPMTPPEGLIEEKIFEQRINTIDLASGTVRAVSPDDVYIYEYDWAPDGKRWAATAAHGSGDNNWWTAHLYTVDAQSGQMHDILKPKLQIAFPRFSPDGKNIAFIGGIMSDQGSTGGRHLRHSRHGRPGAQSHARNEGFGDRPFLGCRG